MTDQNLPNTPRSLGELMIQEEADTYAALLSRIVKSKDVDGSEIAIQYIEADDLGENVMLLMVTNLIQKMTPAFKEHPEKARLIQVLREAAESLQ